MFSLLAGLGGGGVGQREGQRGADGFALARALQRASFRVGMQALHHLQRKGALHAALQQVGEQGLWAVVGVGCFVDTCRECENCRNGLDQYCLGGMIGTYDATGKDGEPTAGGYSTHIVVDENYVLRIPESIPLEKAAPILCAGVTLYSPLKHWKAGPGKHIGIIGLGGLGHMGVQLAHHMGAEVSVLSQSLKKKEDGERLGADHYYSTGDETTFKDLRRTFDVIINAVSANLDLAQYFELLKTDGAFVGVGAPEHPMELPAFSLIPQRRSLSGSMIGSIAETQEVLDFCGEHGFGAEVEVIDADYVNEAYERVVNSDVRYRFVIDIASLA